MRGYYDGLAEGFLRAQHRAVLTVAAGPAELLDRLAAFEPPAVGKWLEREDL